MYLFCILIFVDASFSYTLEVHLSYNHSYTCLLFFYNDMTSTDMQVKTVCQFTLLLEGCDLNQSVRCTRQAKQKQSVKAMVFFVIKLYMIKYQSNLAQEPNLLLTCYNSTKFCRHNKYTATITSSLSQQVQQDNDFFLLKSDTCQVKV